MKFVIILVLVLLSTFSYEICEIYKSKKNIDFISDDSILDLTELKNKKFDKVTHKNEIL